MNDFVYKPIAAGKMKVDKLSSIQATAPKRQVRKTDSESGDFAKALAGEGEVAAPGAAPTVAPTDALLSLQEVPDAVARHARARRHGENLLDRLDDLRLSLLLGRLSPTRIEALARAVAAQRDQVSDPRLAEILDEIELRAAVELAKLGR